MVANGGSKTHSLLRNRLMEKAGISNFCKADLEAEKPFIENILTTIFNLCRNRLFMGFFRYGSNKNLNMFDVSKDIIKKARLYQKTHNTEILVDIINYCALEFSLGTHPDKHWKATDDEDHARGHKW